MVVEEKKVSVNSRPYFLGPVYIILWMEQEKKS